MSRDSPPAPPTRALATFVASVAAWVVGLFGLFRLPLVQDWVLVPFARAQQAIAVAVFGVSPGAIVVDVSCTGSDAMALAFGAILGFPAAWRRRRHGVAAAFLLIAVLNTLRIATLSAVADRPATFDLIHVYVWPGLIVLGAVLYVFRWMQSVDAGSAPGPGRAGNPARQGADGAIERTDRPVGAKAGEPSKRAAWGISGSSGRRFAATSALLVGAYFALSPWILGSTALQAASVWSAGVAGTIMAGLGASASVVGNVLVAGRSAWTITPECIVTPLIPVYLATVICWPTSWPRRGLALAAVPPVFLSLGIARLLVLALPASLAVHTVALHAFYQIALAFVLVVAATRFGRSPSSATAAPAWQRATWAICVGVASAVVFAAGVMILVRPLVGLAAYALPHLGHGYVDEQGALIILPAFQAGLFIALWLASGHSWRSARAVRGLLVLAVQQAAILLLLGELQAHAAVTFPIVALRAYAIAVPVVLVWWLSVDVGASRVLLPSPRTVPSA